MIQTHKLPNGLTIMMERLPHLRSASVGIFVKAGSIMEETTQSGLSHFIEHMAFKGTKNRSARQIAEEIDLLGGNVNAATSKLATSYYARITDKDLKRALDLLADMVVRTDEDEGDFEKERQVILEEISMEADSPEDLVFNLAHEGLYGLQTLSRTILGSKNAIKGYRLQDLQAFRASYYQPGNAVLSVAGHFDPEQFITWSEQAFGDWRGSENKPFPVNRVIEDKKPLTLDKDVEQAHLCLSYPGLPSLHDDRHSLAAFSTAFGGGVSSRLFQKIREDEGLVYNIYSAPSFYPDCGEFMVYAACSPKKVVQVLDLIRQEQQNIVRNGIRKQEFLQTMAQMKTGFVLGMESVYQRMATMGINKLVHDRIVQPRETLALLKKVSMKNVNRVAREILDKEPRLAIVGKKIEKHLNRKEKVNGPA
jgi:predicted Zn-dependent peptidase